MKNILHIYFALTITLFVIVLNACTKEQDNSSLSNKQAESPPLTPTSFNYIGEEHNAGLDYIYSKLILINLDTCSTKTIDYLIKEYAHEFYQISEVTNIDLSIAINLSDDYFDYILKPENQTDSNSFMKYIYENTELTEIQKSLITTMLDEMNNCITLDQIYTLANSINYEAEQLISNDNELITIYIATAVMNYSCTYWYDNISNWSNLNPSAKAWFKWNSVAKEDVKGAIGGAVGGAIVGAVAGGVGAGPGAAAGAVGGGVGASAAEAAGQIWDHIFNK